MPGGSVNQNQINTCPIFCQYKWNLNTKTNWNGLTDCRHPGAVSAMFQLKQMKPINKGVVDVLCSPCYRHSPMGVCETCAHVCVRVLLWRTNIAPLSIISLFNAGFICAAAGTGKIFPFFLFPFSLFRLTRYKFCVKEHFHFHETPKKTKTSVGKETECCQKTPVFVQCSNSHLA